MRIVTDIDLNSIPPLECIDSRRNVWRLRWNFVDGGFEEIQLNHKPGIEEIKEIIINWYNTETSNKIIYGFKWNNIPVCLSKENQSNYMMFCDNDIFPLKLKFGSWEKPIYYTIKTSEELVEFKKAISKHIKECLTIGWSKKDNINWATYEKIIIKS